MSKSSTYHVLLRVDIQNDFIPPRAALPVPDGDAIVPLVEPSFHATAAMMR